jgi:hypothetical protein
MSGLIWAILPGERLKGRQTMSNFMAFKAAE